MIYLNYFSESIKNKKILEDLNTNILFQGLRPSNDNVYMRKFLNRFSINFENLEDYLTEITDDYNVNIISDFKNKIMILFEIRDHDTTKSLNLLKIAIGSLVRKMGKNWKIKNIDRLEDDDSNVLCTLQYLGQYSKEI